MKNRLTLVFVSIAMLGAILGTAIYVIDRPVARWIGFYVWKFTAGKAHGGRYAKINNICIYYETYGAGPPTLVLHGGFGSIEGPGRWRQG